MELSAVAPDTRKIRPALFLLLLMRVPLIVAAILFVLFFDLFLDDVAKESLRYVVMDHKEQLAFIAIALGAACFTLRITSDAMVSLLAPNFRTDGGWRSLAAIWLPRLLGFAPAAALALAMARLAADNNAFLLPFLPPHAFGTTHPVPEIQVADLASFTTAVGSFTLFVLIGAATACLPLFSHDHDSNQGASTSLLLRIVAAFAPLVLVVVLSGGLFGTLLPLASFLSGAPPFEYRGVADSILQAEPGSLPLLLAAAAVGLFATCITLRFAAEALARFPLGGSVAEDRARYPVYWIPRASALLVAFAVAMPFIETAAETRDGYRSLLAGACAIAAIAIGWISGAMGANSTFDPEGDGSFMHRLSGRYVGAATRLAARPSAERMLLCFLFIGSIAIFIFFFDVKAVGHAQFVGPVTVILLWATAAAALFFPLAYVGTLLRVPTLSGLLALGIGISAFDLNDNHSLQGARPLSSDEYFAHELARYDEDSYGRRGIDNAPLRLKDWLSTRADRDLYDHYPVIIVATEGGGIRAAFFTAYALAGIQDVCPAFAQHILGISSVSGGSLGAALFASLAADTAKNAPHFAGCNFPPGGENRKRIREVFRRDLFSPLLAAMLFPDALQRILPVSFGDLDRARALENALADSWERPGEENRIADRLGELYPKHYAGAAPHLFLNTTDVDTGEMRAIATIQLQPLSVENQQPSTFWGRDMKPTINETADMQGVPLAAAAIASARFPYVTPAARVDYKDYLVGPVEQKIGDESTLASQSQSQRCPGSEEPSNNALSGKDEGAKFDRRSVRLVDGGYFESSGAYIAKIILLQALEERYRAASPPHRARKSEKVSSPCKAGTASLDEEKLSEDEEKLNEVVRQSAIYVLSISSTPDDPPPPARGWNELLSPPRALRNTSAIRGFVSQNELAQVASVIHLLCAAKHTDANAIARREDTLCTPLENAYVADQPKAHPVVGAPRAYPVVGVTLGFQSRAGRKAPLTWLLSNASLNLLRNRLDAYVEAALSRVHYISPIDETVFNRHLPEFVAARRQRGLTPDQIAAEVESAADSVYFGGAVRAVVCVLHMHKKTSTSPATVLPPECDARPPVEKKPETADEPATREPPLSRP